MYLSSESETVNALALSARVTRNKHLFGYCFGRYVPLRVTQSYNSFSLNDAAPHTYAESFVDAGHLKYLAMNVLRCVKLAPDVFLNAESIALL